MSPARIVDGRVVFVCRRCAGRPSFIEPTRMAACALCDAEIPEWAARALIVGGRLQTRCAACATHDAEPPPPEITIEIEPPSADEPKQTPPRVRRWNRLFALMGGAGVVSGAMLYAWSSRGSTLVDAAAASLVAPAAPRAVVVPLFLPAPIVAAPAPKPTVAQPAPKLPAGATVYPLAGSDRSLPDNSDANFGGERTGDRPVECGAGHCGIDLRADEGTEVLAARDGVVVGAHRDASGRGGRWIQIDHGEVSTLYFHLDAVRADLGVGTRVVAGETLATLGRTGVQTSPTHLHFAVLVDGAYVDPLRMLRRARVLAAGRGARPTLASATE